MSENITRKRAIIYCRVSSEKQKVDGESLEYQEEKCRQYAELHDIQVIVALAEAKSGFIHYLHREKLTLARQMIRDHVADMIIVWDLRRFSRNFVHSAMIFQEIESNGGEVVSVSENIDNSLTGKLIRSILAWSAESEREKIAEYANRHWQKRHELGLPMATTTPPYGWQWGDKTKTYYDLNPEEAAVRYSIFEMFVEMDLSIRQIGHRLTIDGIATPKETRKAAREDDETATQKLVPWTPGTIHGYLTDVANIGTLIICKKKRVLKHNGGTTYIDHPDKKIMQGAMPPIISEEMFERAQRKLALNQETKSHRPRNPEQYLLTGHVYCAVCGNRMHSQCEKELPVYRCNKHMSIYDPHPTSEPHLLRIKTALVDPKVWEDCCQLFERMDMIQAKIEEEVKRSLTNLLEDTTGQEQLAALRAAIEHAKIQRDSQQNEYLRSLIGQDIQAKTEQLRRYEEECASASSVAALSATYQQRVLEFMQFVNVMKGEYHNASFQSKRNALDVLGVKVLVHPPEAIPPMPAVETDQEWLSIIDVSMLTGIHQSSLRASIAAGRLKTVKKGTHHPVIHRDEVKRFFNEQQAARIEQYDDEWFTVHKLTATIGISNHHDIHQAIAEGRLKTKVKDVTYSYIHREELNRFLRESPIRLRSITEDVTGRIEITYSPLFAGTGVQASLDATTPVRITFALSYEDSHRTKAVAIDLQKFSLM